MADTEDATLSAAVEEASKFWNEAVAASEGKPIQESETPAKEAEEEEKPDSDGGEAAEADEEEGEESETEVGGEAEGQEKEADPWDSVPEELRNAYEETVEKAKKYEHEARSNRGRLASIEKKYRELSHKLESEKTPAKDEKKEPAVDPVDSIFDFPTWQKFRADFGTDVSEPQEAALRRFYEVIGSRYETMDSRLQAIEAQAKSLQQSRSEDVFSKEYNKFHQDFQQLIDGYEDNPETGEPAYLLYARDNYADLEAFVETDEDYQRWWNENLNTLTKPKDLMKLITAFEASRGNMKKAGKSAPKPNGANGAEQPKQPQPEPRSLTPKRKQQLKSAGTIPPRSAPDPGRRSNSDLPDPENFSDAFRFFEAKATR